jgi:hypothetical protein
VGQGGEGRVGDDLGVLDELDRGRARLVLPGLIPERARLMGPHIGDKFVDRGETLLQRLGADLLARQFPDFAGEALDRRHFAPDLLRPS